jgi:hypothetical protein
MTLALSELSGAEGASKVGISQVVFGLNVISLSDGTRSQCFPL